MNITPSGWYSDPAIPGQQRYWDGSGWTQHVAPYAQLQQGPAFRAGNAVADIADERSKGRVARALLFLGALSWTMIFFGEAVNLHSQNVYSQGHSIHVGIQTMGFNIWADSAITLGEVGLLITGIFFIIWLYKAALVSKRMSLPAKLSPGWAAGGWFVPVVNFWFPYQSARDIFPAGHDGRTIVKRWWALWIAAAVLGLSMEIVAWFSLPAGLVFAAIASAVVIGAALTARTLITEVGTFHAQKAGISE